MGMGLGLDSQLDYFSFVTYELSFVIRILLTANGYLLIPNCYPPLLFFG